MNIFNVRFLHDLKDFCYFLRHPTLISYLPPNKISFNSSKFRDCVLIYFKRLFNWVLFLWIVNFCILGPITAIVSYSNGITHKINIFDISWYTVVLWAPIIEEMLFRYVFFQPIRAFLLYPILIPALLIGPKVWSIVIFLTIISIFLILFHKKKFNQLIDFSFEIPNKYFPLIFHFITFLFACMHLFNFSLNKVSFWLLPMLILPQWVTGLVLGWIRTRYGISSSILLHALFNLGPLILTWIFIKNVGISPSLIIQNN
ncbi:MAG: CPBP family intramembrane metalloprotease [Bordetella sp.]|nr:MAG: CPBP family intramembrane metalloprotease [Bordetella sp.]